MVALHRAPTRFNIQTFCPQTTGTLMCYRCLSEQTTYINVLVFITETKCVYCAVPTATLSAIQAMGVSYRPLTIRRSFLPLPSGSKRPLTLKMEGTSTTRDLVNSYQLTGRHTTQQSTLQIYNNPTVTGGLGWRSG